MIELRAVESLPATYAWPVPPGCAAFVAVDTDNRPTDSRADGIVGAVAWRLESGVATVARVWSVPARDHDAEVLDAALRRARAEGATTMTVRIAAAQRTWGELLHDAPVLSTYMTKPVPPTAPPLPPGVDHRPMTDDEYEAWQRTAVEEYAEEDLARCGGNRELAGQRSAETYAELLPDGAATADTAILALTLDGGRFGELWLRHHWQRDTADPTPDETFVFDVHVEPERRGQGLGRAAMVVTERLAHEAGDRLIGLNVFGGNHVAIGLYRSQGYTSQSTVHDVSTWDRLQVHR